MLKKTLLIAILTSFMLSLPVLAATPEKDLSGDCADCRNFTRPIVDPIPLSVVKDREGRVAENGVEMLHVMTSGGELPPLMSPWFPTGEMKPQDLIWDLNQRFPGAFGPLPEFPMTTVFGNHNPFGFQGLPEPFWSPGNNVLSGFTWI